MFRRISQFIKDAGKRGMASEIAAVILYCVALWEHAQDRTVTFYVFACVSVLLFWLGAGLAWDKQYTEAEQLRRKASEIPKIERAKRNGFQAEIRNLRQATNSETICSLVVRFVNNPEHYVESAVARDIRAKIEFFNMDIEQNPHSLFEIDGRWASNPQPSALASNQTNKDILATDIGIGETVELDVAVRFIDESECFAVNNDSWQHSLKKPSLKLEGQTFLAKVRLSGVNVKEAFELKFENRGKWNHLKPLN